MESAEWNTGEVTLSVDGRPLRMQISVPAKHVKPQVMLPIFQKLANAFTDMAVKQTEADGKTISCQKGCGACCRQAIPLSEVEIYYLSMLIGHIAEPQQTEIRRRFAAAAERFRSNGWFERFEQSKGEEELKAVVLEYFLEGIACPFLEEESCSVYPYRPIACREYLVTTPAAHCSAPGEEVIQRIPLPVNASDGLFKLGLTGRLAEKKFLPMVFALEWAEKYPERFTEKRGEEWLAEFFNL